MNEVYTDEIGRSFCKAHRSDHCNICCLSFREPNEEVEKQVGLRRKDTPSEQLAKEKVMLERGIHFMMQQPPGSGVEENLQYHRTELARVERELKHLRKNQGEDSAIGKALMEELDKAKSMDADMAATARAFSNLNPGKDTFELGGEEYQKIYDQFVSPPPSSKRDEALDPFTCSFCRETSTTVLMACGRCKKQAYCGRECQKSHWKAHKKECVPVDELTKGERKKMPLTWKQLEKFGSASGEKLEVRFIEQEPGFRLIALCKDRVGITKRVVAYTNSRNIPDFTPGKVLVWKNPRFHYFMDGSSGARINESDLADIKIRN